MLSVDIAITCIGVGLSEMEAENKLYTEMHGDGHGQPPPNPPEYTPTPDQHQQDSYGDGDHSQGNAPCGPSTTVTSPTVQLLDVRASPYYAGYGRAHRSHGTLWPSLSRQQIIVRQSPVDDGCMSLDTCIQFATVYSCFVSLLINCIIGVIGYALASEYKQ